MRNLTSKLLITLPVILWSFQTTSIKTFLVNDEYSSIELAFYRAIGAIIFAFLVSGVKNFGGFNPRQFVPGIFLAINFITFNIALNQGIPGPLVMTIEASNFVFALVILWLKGRRSEISLIAFFVYLVGMSILCIKGLGQTYQVGLIFALITSLSFAAFNCTVENVKKAHHSTIPLMLPILLVCILLIVVDLVAKSFGYNFKLDATHETFLISHVFSFRTFWFVLIVGVFQTGVAYYCWSQAARQFSGIALALAFLWTVPISFTIEFIASQLNPNFNSNWEPGPHQFIATAILIIAFIIEKKNLFPQLKLALGGRRRKEQVLENLSQKSTEKSLFYQNAKPLKKKEGLIIKDSEIQLINFARSDYLGLSSLKELNLSAIENVKKWGWGTSSARGIGSDLLIHKEAEASLAEYVGKDKALILPSAYIANLTAFDWLDDKSVVLYDDMTHKSVADGINLSLAEGIPYAHKDLGNLEELLNRRAVMDSSNVLIVTDGIFSYNGDFSEVDSISRIAKKYGCFLMVDDSHGIGVLGDTGRGTSELFDVLDEVDILVFSLSKAFGCPAGGAIAGTSEILEFIKLSGRGNFYSNAVSTVVSSMVPISIRHMNDGARRVKLENNIQYLKSGLNSKNLEILSPIGSLSFGEYKNPIEATLVFHDRLLAEGLLTGLITHPYVSEKQGYIRFQINHDHNHSQLDKLINGINSSYDYLDQTNL